MNKSDRFHIPALDGLRFVAFLLVFIHHLPIKSVPVLSALNKVGWLGVEIFLCLSAFLLTRLLCIEHKHENRIHIWNFFIRRTLRVWPLYFSYVIVFPLLYVIVQQAPTDFFWRELGLFTFTDNVFTAFRGFSPIPATGHLWTISYEEQFYLVLPFLIAFLMKKSMNLQRKILLIFMLGGFLCRLGFIMASVKDPAIWVLPITHFESVCIGVFFGLNRFQAGRSVSLLSLLVSGVATVCIFLLPDSSVTSYYLMVLYPLAGVAAGGLVFSVLSGKLSFVNELLSNKLITFLGKISFGLYMFHVASIYLVYYLVGWKAERWGMVALLSFTLTLILAWVSYVVLERPFLRIKSKFTAVPSRPV